MVKYFVQFKQQEGTGEISYSEKESFTRDIPQVEMPDSAFGFRFYTREEISNNGKIYVSPTRAYSKWYYKGELLSFGAAKARFPENKVVNSQHVTPDSTFLLNEFNFLYLLDDESYEMLT